MYEKYHTALRLMDACIATKEMEKPENGWPERRLTFVNRDGRTHAKLHPCHEAWDICFDFIYENFAKPDTAMAEMWTKWKNDHPEIRVTQDTILLTDSKEMERLLRSMPPELAEQVFPVGIARFLLRDAAMPLNHRFLRTFKQFHEWYGTMILAD